MIAIDDSDDQVNYYAQSNDTNGSTLREVTQKEMEGWPSKLDRQLSAMGTEGGMGTLGACNSSPIPGLDNQALDGLSQYKNNDMSENQYLR